MLRKKVCLVGYGSTEYSRKSDRSLLSYYAEAMQNAMAQTGITKQEIHGFSMVTQASPDYSPYVAEQLGLELDWVLNGDCGGAGAVCAIRRAADAIEAGYLDVAFIVAGNAFDKNVSHQRVLEYQRANYVDVYGYGGPNTLFALVQRRHMEEYGTTLEQIGKIATSQRHNAGPNSQALLRAPMSMEDYLDSRLISDPIRPFDCVMPCSGGECIVVASEERAKQITDKPVYLVTDAEKDRLPGVQHAAGQDRHRHERWLGEHLFSEMSRDNVDLLAIYDDYPIAVMMQLEDLGYCAKGQGGPFVDDHDLTFGGDFPVNTGGGELSVGQAGLAGGHVARSRGFAAVARRGRRPAGQGRRDRPGDR